MGRYLCCQVDFSKQAVDTGCAMSGAHQSQGQQQQSLPYLPACCCVGLSPSSLHVAVGRLFSPFSSYLRCCFLAGSTPASSRSSHSSSPRCAAACQQPLAPSRIAEPRTDLLHWPPALQASSACFPQPLALPQTLLLNPLAHSQALPPGPLEHPLALPVSTLHSRFSPRPVLALLCQDGKHAGVKALGLKQTQFQYLQVRRRLSLSACTLPALPFNTGCTSRCCLLLSWYGRRRGCFCCSTREHASVAVCLSSWLCAYRLGCVSVGLAMCLLAWPSVRLTRSLSCALACVFLTTLCRLVGCIQHMEDKPPEMNSPNENIAYYRIASEPSPGPERTRRGSQELFRAHNLWLSLLASDTHAGLSQEDLGLHLTASQLPLPRTGEPGSDPRTHNLWLSFLVLDQHAGLWMALLLTVTTTTVSSPFVLGLS